MKILFVVSDFDMGGITSALRNLTNELINKGHKIDVLNLPQKNKLPKGFNSDIKLIDLQGTCIYCNLSIKRIFQAKGLKFFFLLYLGILKKILNKKGKWFPYIFRDLKIKEYDIAIGFRQSPLDYYVTSIIDSKQKIGFWHGDPDYMGDLSVFNNCINYADKIACVSDAVKNRMKELYPDIKEKLYTVYNIFDSKEINNISNEYSAEYDKSKFNIVTVSRIDFYLKCLEKIPEICKILNEYNFNYKWTIVGNGSDKPKLEQIIKDNNLESFIDLVGLKNNPYPYIKDADLFVLTSESESYGMVVMESLILGTPVIAGNYPALKEILENNKTGIIAENSTKGISKEIINLIKNKDKYNEIKANCMNYKYSPDFTYNQFMDMINDKI